MPPSRYLGLPWPEWGETDFLLTQALRRAVELDAEDACPKGCGLPRSVCADPDHAGMFEIVKAGTCYVMEALAGHKTDDPSGIYKVVLRESVVARPRPGAALADPSVLA